MRIQRLPTQAVVAVALTFWLTLGFCPEAEPAMALRGQVETKADDADFLEQIVNLLQVDNSKSHIDNSESRSEAAKLIRSHPKKSWAIVDEVVASNERRWHSGVQHALTVVLWNASSDQLLELWGTEKRIDPLLLDEISKRLEASDSVSDNTRRAIDHRRGMEVFTQALVTERSRYATLETLKKLPDIEIEQKLFDAIFACLDDESSYTYSLYSHGIVSVDVKDVAIDVLKQLVANRKVVKYEVQLTDLLNDKRSCRREAGIRILSGHTELFERNGDKILAMVHDEDAELQEVVIRHLPVLDGRTAGVVKILTAFETPTWKVVHCLKTIFPKCNVEDQNQIAKFFITRMIHLEGVSQNMPRGLTHLFEQLVPELEQTALDESLDRLLTIFDADNPADWQLGIYANSGLRGKRVAPALRKSLAVTSGVTRLKVASALYRVAGDSDEVLPYFRAALESDDGVLHQHAIRGAKALGPDAVELAPLLTSHLETGPYSHIYVFALRRIGPPAAKVLPRLEAMYEAADEEAQARRHLRSTIQAIRGETSSKQ